MTDNEIIKALECCKETVDCIDNESKCCSCSLIQDGWCTSTLANNALSLINRQKAEIERLTVNANAFKLALIREADGNKTAKAETVKSFTELLKTKFDQYGAEHYYYSLVDDVAKEMGVDRDD